MDTRQIRLVDSLQFRISCLMIFLFVSLLVIFFGTHTLIINNHNGGGSFVHRYTFRGCVCDTQLEY